MRLFLCALLVLLAGCYMDPIRASMEYMKSEAGQKIVDKMAMEAEVKNPQIGFRMYTGGEVYIVGAEGSAQIEGEVSDDERGFAPPPVDPVP